MNNYLNNEIESFITNLKTNIISFFPNDFFIRLILAMAALVIVLGIARLFEKKEVDESNN